MTADDPPNGGDGGRWMTPAETSPKNLTEGELAQIEASVADECDPPPRPIPRVYSLDLRGRIGEIEIDPVEVRVDDVSHRPHMGGWRVEFVPCPAGVGR